MRIARRVLPLLVLSLAVASAHARATVSEDAKGSRAAELAAARASKAAALAAHPGPARDGRVERFFKYVRDNRLLERLTIPGEGHRGIRPFVGAVAPNSGFAGGFLFDRVARPGSPLAAHWTAAQSIRGYTLFRASAGLEELAGKRLDVVGEAESLTQGREIFHGVGNESDRDDESRYRLDALAAGVALRYRAARWLAFGARGGLVDFDPGPGDGHASVEDVFGPASLVGFDPPAPSFWRGEAHAAIDWRDVPGNPRRGGLYELTATAWDARGRRGEAAPYDFRRLRAEVRQYFPYANRYHAFAVRARMTVSDVPAGNEVPFFLLSALGGSHDLRGYDRFRYADRGELLLSAEHVWDLGALFDAAIFADAGQVFRHPEEIDGGRMHADYGLSLRVKAPGAVFLRFDIANGEEGIHAYLTFGGLY